MKAAIANATAIALMAVLHFAHAEENQVFFCNYDVLLTTSDSVAQINSRARVRDGHTIPIEFQNHKVHIAVASPGDRRVEIAVLLFEKFEEHWYQVNPEPLTFSGTLGIPVQYQWSDGELSLDIALSVSSNQAAISE